MVKNIFNKVLISISIIVILFNWIFIYIVRADSVEKNLNDIKIEVGQVGADTYISLKKQVVEELRKNLEEEYNYKGTTEELAQICGIDLTNGTAGSVQSVEGSSIKINDDTTVILAFNMNITTGTNQSYRSANNTYGAYTQILLSDIKTIKNTGEDNTDANNEKQKKLMAKNYKNDVIVEGKSYSGETDWDLGGVILKPLFFLVNCVADTLLGALQWVMYSDAIDNNQLTNYVKTNYIDKLKVVDSRNIDTMFDISLNQKIVVIGTKGVMSNVEYPHIHYSPEEIFSGKISLLNIDFISGVGQAEGLGVVRQTISNCYKVLRLIATIGFLSVLIYTGIKILISSISKQKAKYKEWIIDWLIGFAMLYSMHYIMSFIIAIVSKINEMLNSTMPILRVAAGNGYESFGTNLIGFVRFCTQYDTLFVKIGYEVLYILLVGYTFKFTIIYIKRVISMAFLTMIAPIIAFTYPIDKMIDGKSQSFSTWFKEYIFNALLQPMHFLLYYILVSSSIAIAVKNPIYAIAVLKFMTEAEKMFKKIFGFDKVKNGMVGGLGAVPLLTAAKGMKSFIEKNKMGNNEGNNAYIGYPGITNNDFQESDLIVGDDDISDSSSSQNVNARRNRVGIYTNAETTGNENPNRGIRTESSNNGSRVGRAIINSNNSNNGQQVGFNPIGRPRLNSKVKTRAQKRMENNNKYPIRQIANKVNRIKNKALDNELGRKTIKLANTKTARGVRAVGRKIVKPVWDTQKSASWNGKRLIRKTAKGVVGTAVGITAATVQAGISLTDGKYNPVEGIAAFGAGFALTGNIMDNTMTNFEEGAYQGLTNKEKMEEYKENFRNRDDVIKFCKEHYGSEWKTYRERIIENYVTRGITNFDEIKQCIKYSNKVSKETTKEITDKKNYLNDKQKKRVLEAKQDEEDAVAISILLQKKIRKKKNISSITYDKEKEKEYLDVITNGMKDEEASGVRRQEVIVSAAIRYFDKMTS